jgi:hypothetical protein
MSAIVDYTYYTDVYMGTEADKATFPALNAHAARMIQNLCHMRVSEENIDSFAKEIQTRVRLAVCAQIDFLAINGIESINTSGGGGFTVGKVTVHATNSSSGGGALRACISPEAFAYLEQIGLMNPQVPTIDGWC